jgi:DMSO/TMAO reductase YedYZ molybdopterin-dependent catalytic subunit
MQDETALLICPTVFADNEALRGFTISSLMNAAGLKTGAIQLVFHSVDNIQQTVAITDALTEDALLALEVDGQTLSREHGYPLRLVRPGQLGVFWLKCISDIEIV